VASLLALIWQNGGAVLNASQTQAEFAEPRTREAIEYFASFYLNPAASPGEAFTGWAWDGDGVRINRRWWTAMTQAPAPTALGVSSPANFGPQILTAKERLELTFLGWLDEIRDAVGSHARFASPMRFAPLPKGRQRATALGVTATLSVSHQAKDPDTAAMALALLADRVSQSVVPSARRMTTDVMQRLAPHYTPEQVHVLSDALADSRGLEIGDEVKASQVRLAIWRSLVLPVQSGMRALDDIVVSANRAVQDILDRPWPPLRATRAALQLPSGRPHSQRRRWRSAAPHHALRRRGRGVV
jgi:hypothetical protein